MKTATFVSSTGLPVSACEGFAWHERPGALERLTPPWQNVRIIEQTGGIRDGDRVVLRIKQGPIAVRWLAEHRDYRPGESFTDVQIRGPFGRWEHTHAFEAIDDERCRLTDRIEFAPPLGAIGRTLGGRSMQRTLARTFRYRHAVTSADLALHRRFATQRRLSVAISGSSGLIGSALASLLTTGGHHVIRLTRRPARDDREAQWSPETGIVDFGNLEGVDAVIHLAGENLVAGRWTDSMRQRIRDSRVVGTRKLCESLGRLKNPPQTLISASAIGYYGDRGETTITEDAGPGSGFLAKVGREWEEATEPAERLGLRVVHPRIGIVLSPRGGALQRMLTPARFGLNAVLGSGRQYMSWIGIDDAIAGIYHALMSETIRGPVNLAAPEPVTNREFTETLGRVLRRPVFLRVPESIVRLIFGRGLADEVLLRGARVRPCRLLESGFTFRHPTLEDALRHVLGRWDRPGRECRR